MFARNKRLIIFGLIILFLTVLLTSVTRKSYEGDELIYQTLAIKLQNFQSYNLTNTQILKTIPKEIYDTKIFFYPPTFIILLSFFHFLFGNLGFHILPPILYLCFAIVIYKTVRLISNSENDALKGLVISFFSPMLLFVSVRTSMDLFMVLLSLLSFYFLLIFEKNGKNIFIFLSGLTIILSILTKYIPIIILLFYFPILLEIMRRKKLLKKIYLFFVPFLLLFFWGDYFLKFSPSFNFFLHNPNSNVLAVYKFLDYAYHRPLYFYFINTFLVNPVFLLMAILFFKKEFNNLKEKYGFIFLFLIEIIIFILLSFTLIGVWGGTFQMRYILLAEPFLIILLSLINFEKYKLTRILFFIFLVHNFFVFLFNVVILNTPENFSLFEISRFLFLQKLG